MTCVDLLNNYPTPYYMKIDIEGFDHLCLYAINETWVKPKYISVEAQQLALLIFMRDIGYTK
jgi:hypothetical protein